MVDVMQMVTDRIIAKLEKGTVPWRKPWICHTKGAFNRISGRPYSLLNQLLLTHGRGEYATFDQWSQLGGSIRKGEKAETVVFWRWPEDKAAADTESMAEDDKEEKKRFPILKYYHVFHISQVEGVEPLKPAEAVPAAKPIDIAETIFRSYVEREGIKRDIGSYSDAYYSPSRDEIHAPGIWLYKSSEPYYGTLLHEAIHSTGAQKRLNRPGLQSPNFGSELYSKEELIAEIGSMVLLAHAGIDTAECFENSSSYISGWLSVLKSDKRMVPIAAGQAEKAMKFILSASEKQVTDI